MSEVVAHTVYWFICFNLSLPNLFGLRVQFQAWHFFFTHLPYLQPLSHITIQPYVLFYILYIDDSQ